jgi:nucleolar protein 15
LNYLCSYPTDELSPEMEEELRKLSDVISAKSNVVMDPKARREAFIAKRAKVHAEGGVVVISRLPYGFFEDQLKSFFSQFGVVRKLRLSRNKKTGKSRHFAFMEFDNKEVAAIVADTMDGYMMFNRTMQCKYIPPQHVHPDTFRNHHKSFKVIPWNRIERLKHNAERTDKQIDTLQSRLKSGEKKRRARLAALGYDYDFSGFEGKAMITEQPKKKAVKKSKTAAVEEVAEVKPTKKAKAAVEVVAEAKPVKKARKAAAIEEEEVAEAKPSKKTRKAAVVEEVVEAKPVKKTRKVAKK